MKPLYRNVLVGYGVFAVGNLVIARASANTPPGTNKLVDLNTRLLRFNLLAHVFPPTLMAAAGPQLAIPTGATVTDQPSGVTTTFGP